MFPQIPVDDLNIPQIPSEVLLITSQYSSDSAISRDFFYRIIESENEKEFKKQLEILKQNIGEELFEKLSFTQKQFMVGISGTISLGDGIDQDSFNSEDDDDN